jgi:hypothetical protein
MGYEIRRIMAEVQPRNAADRRSRQRFPLHLALRYRRAKSRVVSDWTTSQSLNISSTGLFFMTPELLPQGEAVEAFLVWPVSLDNRVPLKLILKGSIARTDGDRAAMRFETYEFKTRNVAEPVPDSR